MFATKTRDKPLTAKQIREIFMRHVKDLDINVLGCNELKAAFSELGASYPDFRADRALVFDDANGDAWSCKSDDEMGMFLSDERLWVVFKKLEAITKKKLKKAFNHCGLFFPEYADNVLDQYYKDGFFESKQFVEFAVQYGKKIREYDSKRLLKEHLKRLSGIDLQICSAQVTEGTDFAELTNKEPWLSSTKLVVKPDMLFGKRGKSGLVALNLDLAQVAEFVKARLGAEVEMGGCKAPITTFIVEPFVPHDQEFYISIVSERLGSTISFSECGGIEIEENWDKNISELKILGNVHSELLNIYLKFADTTSILSQIRGKISDFIIGVFSVFQDLDFSFLEMNPFTLVNGEPYPLDMRGELDDTAAFKNFKKWGNVEFPLPFGRVLSSTESFIHSLDEKTSSSLKFTVLNPKGRIWTMVAGGGASVIYADTVGDLGYASELGNYAEYSGAPNEDEVLQYARVVIDCATSDPDGRKRALLIGGGIANFTDVAATFNGIIRALREKESKLKAARMNIYVRRGGPNYQTGLAKMRTLGDELGVPLEVYGPEATMTGICKQAIDCIMSTA
ncbi:hypothetical protein SADUNF_Sadunf05G0003400 [Salix dunnii]|uniref:ATP citrate synthase n=1 Tax=Salix dunnii TaxID=1413687 RepID=A0A835N1G1_9ROSI|nr:hypothetical protein SADUNF_Sadunf05G0003400 [Salix dunnii]